ncbi:MAG: MFS transporter [Candidatus Odinarchaeota archaeon]|nr:MFS transporter [Candidatus Odinarchaeota archaeon]
MKRIDKIFYGMGRFGSTTLLSVVSLATFYIYLSKYGLDPWLNGIANGIGKLIIAFSGFFVGYLSDKTIHPRLGRRKPFIISGAIALAISFIMLFIPEFFIPLNDQILVFVYETVWNGSFQFFYGYLLTPYQAWLPEITWPEERVEVSGYENTFNILGNIVGIVGSFALPVVIEQGGLLLFQVVVLFGIIEILFYLPAYIRIQEPKKYIKQPNIIRETLIALKNKNYVTWLIAQGFMSIGLTILITIVLTYIETVLQLTGILYLAFGGELLVVVVIFFLIWNKLSKRWKIKRTMNISLAILILSLPLTWFIGQYPMPLPTQTMGFVLIALAASGLSGYWLFPYVIIAHIVEADEIITGESRAGMYTGFNSIPLNFFQAAAYVITGYVVGLPNMLGYYLWGPVCSIFILIGLLIFQLVETDFDFEKLKEIYKRPATYEEE